MVRGRDLARYLIDPSELFTFEYEFQYSRFQICFRNKLFALNSSVAIFVWFDML